MANNMSSRQACHAARYVVARVLRGLFWCLKYTVILPLATIALMTLFVLWKDNTTPGKLLVKEINFVRQTALPDSSRSVNAGFLPLILQADQKYRVSAITARLMLQIMSGRLTGH